MKKKARKLIMTINATILNEIWKAQNSFKHEQKKIPTVNIIKNIKRNLKEIIKIHYNKHEKNNTMSSFQKKVKTLYAQSKTIFLLLKFEKIRICHTPFNTHTHTTYGFGVTILRIV